MNNYIVKLSRNETLSIIAGLQKEREYQHAQAAMYQKDTPLMHFASYHNCLKKRADTLIDKLLELPGMAEANNQTLLNCVGKEPEFVIALALSTLNQEEASELFEDKGNYSNGSVTSGNDAK